MSGKLPLAVPLPAQNLLDFIGGIEAPKGFDTIFGNRQHKIPVPLTQMNYGDIVDAQKNWGNKAWVKKNWGFGTASSAAGRYQFMRDTLIGIAREISELNGKFVFDATLQNKLGYYLLLRRGYDDFITGKISVTRFGLNLAREWASFPVLASTQGQHRAVTRGQSYYAGDGLNKALVKPEDVERRLEHVLELVRLLQEPPRDPRYPAPPKAEATGGGTPAAPVAPAAPKVKPVRRSGRFWTWLLAGGISSTTITEKLGAFQLDWRVQIALLAVIVGFAVYAIATMPAVRNFLGIGDAERT